MNGMLDIFRRDARRGRVAAKTDSARRRRNRHVAAFAPEALERRSMLAVDVSEPTAGELVILYNQADPITGIVSTSDQHVTIEIENVGVVPLVTRVNVYTASNPTAQVFTGIDLITVTVPNFDSDGVVNNSLTIKGINIRGGADRIIMTGSGRTAAGRWSDQDPTAENQVLLEISGIDDLTLTAGGIINVGGSFTNNTNDASIKAFGTEPEEFEQQYAGTVVIGETTPVSGTLPHPGLFSNYIEVVGAEIDILGDILATDHVILRAGEKTNAGQSLVLPYDITVTGSEFTGAPGRLELFSTQNIVQLQSSTLKASQLVAVSNDADAPQPGGPWMIDLGSENNDFDTVALGMVSAPGDDPTVATEGRIGIRDLDDIIVADFGILASTGRVTINALGALRFESPIQATGLTAISTHSIASTVNAVMSIGDGGIDLQASDTFDETATGDITLAGPIVVNDTDVTAVVSNKIVAKGTATINGAIYAPLAGSTTISGSAGVVINAPVQVGSSKLNATSTVLTVYDHDLMLISDAGSITVADAPGGDAVPRTLQATNLLSFDAANDVSIAGAVFAGTLYGNPLALVETEALPAITIVAGGEVDLAATGTLQTSSYENSADDFPNPLLGLISITEANQVNLAGRVIADGAVDIDVTGDIYITGPVTARESITAATTTGSIDVQGAVRSTGYTYTTTPPGPLLEQRTPNVTLSAPLGGITTSGLGTLRAGTMLSGVDTVYGEVRLDAQQDIVIGADIDTDGSVLAVSKLGAVEMGALVRTGVHVDPELDNSITLQAATGITQLEFGRLQTELLDVEIADEATAADISLPSRGNRVEAFVVRNLSPGGATEFRNDSVVTIRRIETRGDVDFISTGTISITGLAQSVGGSITIDSQGGGVNVQTTVLAPEGGVSISATGQIVQRGGNVVTIYLLSGGRDYSYAIVTLDPPPGAGDVALAQAVITPYPVGFELVGDGVKGFISSINLLNGGWGYPSGTRVAISIDGDGEGAAAVAETSIVTSAIEARDAVSLQSGDGITLVSAIRSSQGDVDIVATRGDVSVESITAGGDVEVTAERGKVNLVSVAAGGNATVTADQGLKVTDSLRSGGDIELTTTIGDMTFVRDTVTGTGAEAVLAANAGSVTLTSSNGGIVTPYTINARDNVTLTSFNTLELVNEITSQQGDILATSTSGRISLAANLVAEQGEISLEAQTRLEQRAVSGVTRVDLLSAGPVLDEPPVVTVTIEPPRAGGGRAAVAAAIIERRAIIRRENNADVVEYEYFIGSIVVLDPGEGYAVGEQPLVTVTGVAGVVAQAFGPASMQMVTAQGDISFAAGENLGLLTKIRSVAGDISITSKTGDIDLSSDSLLLSAEGGSIEVVATRGTTVIERAGASGNVSIDSLQGVTVEHTLYAETGKISVTSANGAADVRNLNAGAGVSVSSFLTATLAGEIAAQQGDISASSGSGGIFLDANVVAEEGSISLAPQTFLLQRDGTGIEAVRVVAAGSVLNTFPQVEITIAPPAAPGGEAATAIAVIGQRAIGADDVNDNVEFFIESIRITNPGRGYALGENPIVTLEGLDGAIAAAVGPQNVRNLWAQENISITAGNDVTLLYVATTEQGDITISSTSGDVDVEAESSLLHAVEGSVSMKTLAGGVAMNRVTAGADVTVGSATSVALQSSIDADGAITITSGIGNVSLKGQVYAESGDIAVRSISGSVSLAANIHADDAAITVTAHGGVFQAAGSGVQRIQLLYGGESQGTAPPVVTVGIAPPKNGGVAAEAFAVLRAFTNAVGDTRYTIDEIVITNAGRGYEIGEAPDVTIDGIDGAAAIAAGPSGYQDIVAEKGIVIAAGETVVLNNTLRSNTLDVVISSIDGMLNLGAQDQLLHAVTGAVKLDAKVGGIDANRIYAYGDAALQAGGLVSVVREVVSETGDVVATSGAGSVLVAANVLAKEGAIRLTANHQVRQTSQSGISSIEVVTGGQFVGGQNAPTVTVTVAPPATGGVPAEAVAISDVIGFTRELEPRPIWSVLSVLITNPGSGYAIGERPLVTISGIPGALAVANGPSGMQSLIANDDIVVAAGDNVLLVDKVRSNEGDISITSISGDVDLGTPGQMLHATQGAIEVVAASGAIDIHRAYADGAIVIRAGRGVTLQEDVVSETGNIAATSISGSMFITSNIHAIDGDVSLTAHQSMVQTRSTGVSDVDIVASGSFTGNAQPTVTVTIAAPLAGGAAAVAQAIVDPIGANSAGTTIWGVTSIVVTDPGNGYAVGERPLVTITGVTGAIAIASGPTGNQSIVGQGDVVLAAGSDVTVSTVVRSNEGKVEISSIDGDVDLSATEQLLHAVQGSVVVASAAGSADIQQIRAGADVTVATHLDAQLLGQIDATTGDVTVTSMSGDIVVETGIHASAGSIALTSNAGLLEVTDLVAGQDIELTASRTVTLNELIHAIEGDIAAYSQTGSVSLNGAVLADFGQITLSATAGGVSQSSSSGVTAVNVLSGGTGYTAGATVTIAAPTGGGSAATAVAVVTDGVVTGITITNPGSGYAVGESPVITITGGSNNNPQNPATIGSGAAAVAVGPTEPQNIIAGKDIVVTAQTSATFSSTLTSRTGDILLSTIDGDLNAGASAFFAHALAGRVEMVSTAGQVIVERVVAANNASFTGQNGVTVEGEVDAGGAIAVNAASGPASVTNLSASQEIKVSASGGVSLNGVIHSTKADISAASETGSVGITAALIADAGAISLSSPVGSVIQTTSTGVSAVDILTGGSGYDAGATVTIAPPSGGGEAATAVAIVSQGVVTRIVITNPGVGYALGENPTVTISAGTNPLATAPGTGASAVAVGPAALQNILAERQVNVYARSGVTLVSTVTSRASDLSIVASEGDVALDANTFFAHAVTGSVQLISESGSVLVQRVKSGLDMDIRGEQGVTVEGDLNVGRDAAIGTKAGQIAVLGDAFVDGDLRIAGAQGVQLPGQLVTRGDLEVSAPSGQMTTSNIEAVGDISLTSRDVMTLSGIIQSTAGNVGVSVTAGGLALAANIVATKGAIDILAHSTVTQQGNDGVSSLVLVSPGSVEVAGNPNVQVQIAAPSRGGVQATAIALLEAIAQRTEDRGFGGSVTITTYTIRSLVITNAGSGYLPGENPAVTITGMPQALATAEAGLTLNNLVAETGVTVVGGDTVTLRSVVATSAGDIAVKSANGDLALGDRTFFAHAQLGSVVLESARGGAVVGRVAAERDVIITGEQGVSVPTEVVAGRDIVVTATSGEVSVANAQAGGQIDVEAGVGSASQYAATVLNLRSGTDMTVTATGALGINGQIVASKGDIALTSVSDSIDLTTANINSIGGAVRIDAHGSVIQPTSSGVNSFIEVTSRGTSVGDTAPEVTVTIAPPLNGGTPATAAATVVIIGWVPAGGGAIIIPPLGSPVVVPQGDTPVWGVTGVTVTNLGSGYAPFENPVVSFEGINNAAAVAYGPGSFPTNIVALNDVVVAAGEDVRLTTVVRSNSGDVMISAVDGNVDLREPGQLVHALGGSIAVTSKAGYAMVQQLTAADDIVVDAHGAVTMLNAIDSEIGDVSLTSRTRNLDFTAFGALIYAEEGSVTLSAANGAILTPPTLNVGTGVTITSLNTVALRNEITAATGDISVQSISGSITTAANINAIAGDVSLVAHGTVTQLPRGIHSVEVLTGGSGYNAATTVTIAAPADPDGVQATARPIIGASGALIGVQIVNPGSGYGVNEQPVVTITPAANFTTGTQANAIAHVTQGLLNIAAGQDVSIDAGNGVSIINPINSTGGSISVETVNGNVDFGPNAVVSAPNGGVILDSLNGSIVTPPVLQVDGTIALRTYGDLNLPNGLTSFDGSVALESRNGAIAFGTAGGAAANLIADDRITLVARRGITQPNGFIKARELEVTNSTVAAVTLTNPQNDVENMSILNLGVVTYTDANDFEVGLEPDAAGSPYGVAVRGSAVSLASLEEFSRIRVVGGLQYSSLSIGAANSAGANVGTVEFVPTSEGDNPAPTGLLPTFGGTLRDMIRYINDNTAVYSAKSTIRSQPMDIVFDEGGYAVDTITVSAVQALPTINRAVTLDGGRLEQSVLDGGQTRLNITQAPSLAGLPYGLAFAPAIPAVPGKAPAYPGSTGSKIQNLAVYGFTKGSALVVGSANNTVTNVYAGLRADGTADGTTQNFVGLDVTGSAATGNLVGSTVFDEATANRFAGNTSAGILIRNGASGTRVYGSVIGDAKGGSPELANGDGIRISAATGNWIGTPDAVQPDQNDSVSNVIAGNLGSGVTIVNSIAGALAAANVVRNNRIDGNGVGVAISASRFAVLGGADGESGNTIVSQKRDGVSIVDSTDVQLVDNLIGVTPATAYGDPEMAAGNLGHGVSITGKTQRVQLFGGNRISANAKSGVSMGAGVTGVALTGNTIGGLLDDGVTEVGNLEDGVTINAAIGNTVGVGNLISRNGRNGVSMVDTRSTALMSGNRVTGSTISENAGHGVHVSGGSASTVGGGTAADANVIQGNAKSGIYLERSARTGVATGFAILGNFVGTNTNREVDETFGNEGGGIVVNDGTGVRIEGNTVMNNRQGLDAAGDVNDGITLRGGTGNIVGGATVALGNLVANNQRDGIRVVGTTAARAARGHWITGNTIVDNGDAEVVGDGNGVTVTGKFATAITVGQSVTTRGITGLGNVIQRNAGFGVRVAGGAQQVSIQGNSIAENLAGGISIAAGSNTSTAAGITITAAKIRQPIGSRPQIQLQGRITGAVRGQQYTVDVYANAPEDSEYGGYQARRFLGRVTVTATANGTITWTAAKPLAISANVAVGEYITATVTALRVEPGSTSNISTPAVRATR